MTQPADRRLLTEAAGNATYATKAEVAAMATGVESIELSPNGDGLLFLLADGTHKFVALPNLGGGGGSVPTDPVDPPALVTFSSTSQVYDLEVQQWRALHELWDTASSTSPTKVQEYINTALAEGPLAAYTGVGEVAKVSAISIPLDARVSLVRTRYVPSAGLQAADALIAEFDSRVKSGEVVL